jgi:hypothetical protein
MRTSPLWILLLAAPVAAQAPSDPYLGTFAGDGGSITVAKEGATYRGSISANGVSYRYEARKMGQSLVGAFEANGSSYLFQASVAGDQMTFIANGETTILTRGRGASSTAAARAPAARGGQAPAAAASGQDAQLQQLLLSSPWCYMRYSQTLGSTSTERAQFFPDGRLQVQSNYEMVSSGRNGTAYGSNSGGAWYRWQVENGDLQIAEQGGAFAPAGLRVTRNSNGYPILNANGKEYSMCN